MLHLIFTLSVFKLVPVVPSTGSSCDQFLSPLLVLPNVDELITGVCLKIFVPTIDTSDAGEIPSPEDVVEFNAAFKAGKGIETVECNCAAVNESTACDVATVET